ncbi:MAG: hypothetical protein IKV94_04840 [Clostridia bacterium]|nr:hypothetical protein [Clostridia bacterium]
MLGKLLKYDLKWIYKVVVIFYILAIIFSIVARVTGEIENSLLFEVISKISISCAISMAVSSLINSLMRSWVRFTQNMYKDESYLTHTLPVKKKDLFNSKVISGAVCIITTMIVILLCLFICFYSEANMEILKSLLELAATTYNTTVLNLLLLVAMVFGLELIYVLLTGYLGLILGHKSNTNKMLKSILLGFLIYSITQIATVALIGIGGLFSGDIMNLINTVEAVNIETIKNVMYMCVGVYFGYSVLLYIIARKQLNKGVNVE